MSLTLAATPTGSRRSVLCWQRDKCMLRSSRSLFLGLFIALCVGMFEYGRPQSCSPPYPLVPPQFVAVVFPKGASPPKPPSGARAGDYAHSPS